MGRSFSGLPILSGMNLVRSMSTEPADVALEVLKGVFSFFQTYLFRRLFARRGKACLVGILQSRGWQRYFPVLRRPRGSNTLAYTSG